MIAQPSVVSPLRFRVPPLTRRCNLPRSVSDTRSRLFVAPNRGAARNHTDQLLSAAIRRGQFPRPNRGVPSSNLGGAHIAASWDISAAYSNSWTVHEVTTPGVVTLPQPGSPAHADARRSQPGVSRHRSQL